MERYLLAIDQGTTGTTALLIDTNLRIAAKVNREFPQIYPQPGWVEHDPEAIWTSVTESVAAVLAESGVSGEAICGIGITNQRETTVIWDRQTHAPIHNAIVWQCRRTADRCAAMRDAGHEALIKKTTGLVVDAYFSGTKAAWILDRVDGARARAEAGELAFGTIDTFVTWRLTGGAAHVTDPSNASRTMLYDIHQRAWSEAMCDLIGVPTAILPDVAPSAHVYGTTQGVPGLPDGIPVAGMAGDQQSALFGQLCTEAGMAKCTYGTGAFLLMNTGAEAIGSEHGLLTTVAWQVGDEFAYALEGSVFIAGAAVQWLRDGLCFIENSPDVETLAASVPDTGGVTFVPALAGLGAPHWREDARGIVTGLTRGTTRAHLARATLEGIAMSCAELLEAMQADLGRELSELRVDGGASANNLLMQMQAELLGCDVVRPEVVETTALGAAILAGIGVGIFEDVQAAKETWHEERRFRSESGQSAISSDLRQRWDTAIRKA
ncbi:MAG: glycerol kinase GlpK [Myxococcales bacterium]|nr:glycerol kinase GlpK [Myxococcales bacterium]